MGAAESLLAEPGEKIAGDHWAHTESRTCACCLSQIPLTVSVNPHSRAQRWHAMPKLEQLAGRLVFGPWRVAGNPAAQIAKVQKWF